MRYLPGITQKLKAYKLDLHLQEEMTEYTKCDEHFILYLGKVNHTVMSGFKGDINLFLNKLEQVFALQNMFMNFFSL